MSQSPVKFLSSAAISRRYDVTQRTILRWIKNPPQGFPQPIKIGSRNMWREDEILEYERLASLSQATEAA